MLILIVSFNCATVLEVGAIHSVWWADRGSDRSTGLSRCTQHVKGWMWFLLLETTFQLFFLGENITSEFHGLESRGTADHWSLGGHRYKDWDRCGSSDATWSWSCAESAADWLLPLNRMRERHQDNSLSLWIVYAGFVHQSCCLPLFVLLWAQVRVEFLPATRMPELVL